MGEGRRKLKSQPRTAGREGRKEGRKRKRKDGRREKGEGRREKETEIPAKDGWD